MVRAASVLDHPDLHALRDVHLHDLSFEGLDELTAARLRRISSRRQRGLTVERALRTLRARDRDILLRWLESMVEDDDLELRPGMSRVELADWADERGLQWAVAWPADVVGTWSGFTVGDVLCGDSRVSSRWNSAQLAERAIGFLESAASEAEIIADYASDRRDTWARAPVEAALRPLWRSVWARYTGLCASVTPTLPPDDAIDLLDDPPSVRIRVLGRPYTFAIESGLVLPEEPHLALACCIALLDLVHCPPAQLLDQLRIPGWQRELEQLERLVAVDPLPDDEDKRLVGWEIGDGAETLSLSALQCRYTRSGRLQGRRVDAAELPAALLGDPVDAAAASRLSAWSRPPPEIALEAIAALAGHPRVVFAEGGRREPVEVRHGALRLHVARQGERLVTRFLAGERPIDPERLREALVCSRRIGGNLLGFRQGDEVLVVRCTLPQRRFVEQWLRRSPDLPLEALQGLLARLPALQSVCDIALDPELRGRVVEGDPRTLWRVSYRNDALVVEARIQPVPDAPSFPPGEGPETLHVVRGTEPACVSRDRRDEAGRVRAEAEALGLRETIEQRPFVWAVDDRGAILDLVERLDPTAVRLEVDGSLPRVARATTADLQLEVRSTGHDWFGMDGSVATSLGEVGLEQLVAAVEEGQGWVPVGKNAFVRLESALRQQLSALAPARGASGALALLAVHSPLLHGLEDAGATVAGSEDWRDLVGRIREAATLRAEVPDGLAGTLRPYQLEGYRWLASLAQWAPGAVLADDMGLGKTIQTIALLLRRAELGPALVVAPTSVVSNWRTELERFAPSLTVRAYQGADREAVLVDLGASTVVLTSYGILQRDGEALAEVDWATSVLDEAQAVKNPTSQRSRAAVALSSRFRLALSGTPIENRCEELWSVFATSVPGLLGPLKPFSARFGGGDAGSRRALARLVAPFVLRRSKRVVAADLPERTDLDEVVALSDDHRALYERARLDAIARIEAALPRERRILVLSQLTRLRQLACDPRMIDPGCGIVGAKVSAVLHRLRTVREGGARALVFSSFVGHLELLRELLEAEGFRVAWLTGSTPAAARPAEIERFQAGEADVFLISLKAGGTGLNLTAASYVFHLDPWWNPAAEDQATDRAHRIGQTEPVTVYRLVAAGTIEEQILALHGDKRDLVEAVLEGTDSSRPVGAEELMALLADPTAEPVPAPAEPVAPEPVAAEPGLEAWLDGARERLERRWLKPSTRSTYLRAIEQFAAWARSADRGGDVDRAVADYYEAVRRGELPRTRRTMLSAALGGSA